MNPIVIPLHNNLHLTKAALASCLSQDIEGDVSVWLLNDASSDSTANWLNSLTDPRVTVVHFPLPMGVTPLWNMALDWLLPTSPYALVLNNDLELRPDTYRLLAGDGGGFVTGVPVSRREEMERCDPSHRITHPCFSCFLIRQDVWMKVGPFDRSMVFVAQDCDYHLRLHDAGIDAYAIDLPFYHITSSTLKNSSPEELKRLCKRCDDDRAAFKKKWGFEVSSVEYGKKFEFPVKEHANVDTK